MRRGAQTLDAGSGFRPATLKRVPVGRFLYSGILRLQDLLLRARAIDRRRDRPPRHLCRGRRLGLHYSILFGVVDARGHRLTRRMIRCRRLNAGALGLQDLRHRPRTIDRRGSRRLRLRPRGGGRLGLDCLGPGLRPIDGRGHGLFVQRRSRRRLRLHDGRLM